ncbi:MAG: hypothetical protein AB1439_05360 [candidate division FCPU426 bacterium]
MRIQACTLLLLTLGLLPASALAVPVLVHQPPTEAEAGKPLPLSATITDAASPIVQVKLYYRPIGGLSYREEIMQGAGVSYSAQIPGSSVTEEGLEYYLEARNQAGERGTSPQLNPTTAPHRVLVRRATVGPTLELLLPEDGATLTAEEAMVVVRIDPGTSQTDLKSLKVIFDEADVTASVEKNPSLLTFVPPAGLTPGLHGLQVVVRNTEGQETKSKTWSFTISTPEAAAAWKAEKEAAAKLAAFRGNLRVELQDTSLGKKPQDTLYLVQPEGWLHRVNLNFSGGSEAWQFLGTGYLTSEEAPGRQPVNRFRLDVVNPALSVSLGDTYPIFTDFTLNNCFVRGGYLRWIMGDASQAHSELHLAGGWNRVPIEGREPDTAGTFERLATGFRWLSDVWSGIGFSLNADAVLDNAQSLKTPVSTLPENNIVGSAEGHIKINYLPSLSSLFYGEYGMGYYDQNMNFFTVSLGDAYRGGMRWEWNNRSAVEVEYKRTGSKFVSLGNPWLISDQQGVDSNARLYLFDDQLIILGELNVWQDNVDNQKTDTYYLEAANTTITAGTTNTVFVSGMAYYRLPPYLSTLSLGYSVNTQQDNSQPVPIIDNRTSVFTLGLGSQIPSGPNQLLANLTYSLSVFQDLAQTKLSGDLTTGSLQLSAIYAFGPWSLSAGYGLNRTYTDLSGYTAGLTAIQAAGATKQILDYSLYSLRGNWKAVPNTLDLGLSWENLAGKDDLTLVDDLLSTVALYGTYYIRSGHSLGLTLSSIGYGDKLQDANSYQELVANLQYNLNF